jgi:hypothetical protein
MTKLNCSMCNYDTERLFNYNKHLTSTKHIKNIELKKTKDLYKYDFKDKKYDSKDKKYDSKDKKYDSKDKKYDDEEKKYDSYDKCNIRQNKINCKYCLKLINYTNMSKHHKICKKKNVISNDLSELIHDDPLEKIQELTTKLQSKEEEINKLKLEKELDMIKTKYELAIEQNEKYEDIIKNQSSKVTYNINYIMNNCKDAYNYDELMNEPLTIEEINDLNDSSALVGSTLDP